CQKCGLNFDDGSLLSLHQCLDAADSEHLKIPSEKDSDFLQLQQKVAVASQKVYLLLQDSTTEEKKCVCPICKKEFALPGELKEHFRGHHSGPQLAFTCGEGGCSFTTEERKQFHSHLKHAHEVTPVPCPHHFCSLLFSSRQEMELHCRNHSPFHCSHCNFVSSNVKLFWQHRKRHAKPLEGRLRADPSVPALDELIQEESMEEEEEGPCHKCKRPLRDDGVGESESSKGDDGIGETVKNNPPGQRRFKGDVEEGTEHLFRTHMCPECKRCFKKRTHLVEHLHLHFPDPSLQCPNCQKYFTSKSKLKIHLMREMGQKAHRCPLCDYSSVEKNALNRHMASMHENIDNFYSDVYACPVCEETFRLSQALKEHLKSHKVEQRTLACFREGCSYATEDRKEFSRHLKDTHGQKAVECKYHACALLFSSREEMETHRKSHYAFHCDQCDFVCSNKHVFRRHKRQGHPGSQELRCDFCPYRSFNPVEYNDHVGKMHASEKIHKCAECPFATAHKRVLIRHMLLHTGEKPHKCDQCDFTCRDVSYLSKHMLTHSDDKNYMCTECGYVTKWKHYLNVHMRKHTGDLRYQCNQCSYRCHRADQLSSHKLRHQGKSLICEVCGFACKRKYELQKHMQAKHSEDYQIPMFQCQYCSYQTKYKQALLNHENCKHTKQKEFRCALCPYKTFSNTSLFFHKRKVHGYIPGDKEWLDNYAKEEMASNSLDLLVGFGYGGSALRSDPPLGQKKRTSPLESQEEIYQRAFGASLFGHCSTQPSDNREEETNTEHKQTLLKENDHVSASAMTESGRNDGLEKSIQHSVESHTEELAKESAGSQLENIEPWSCQETDVMCSVARPESSLVTENTGTVIQDPNGLEHRDDVDGNSDCNMAEIGMDVEESSESGSSSPECSASQSELVLKALRKQDKEQAETLVLEGRVQMLVVQSEARIFKCERCSYVTRKEKSMILHSKSSCQNRKGSLACKECGACFKQQRGLNTHLLKKCPVLLKRNKLLLRPTPTAHPKHTCDRSGQPQPEDTAICEDKTTERANLEGEKMMGVLKKVPTIQDLSSHLRQKLADKYRFHQEKFHCNFCSFTCSRKSTIASHVKEGCKNGETENRNGGGDRTEYDTAATEEDDEWLKSAEEMEEGCSTSEMDEDCREKRLSCLSCPFTCYRERAMATHKKRGCMKPGEFQCTLCSFICKSAKAMNQHRKHHRKCYVKRPQLKCKLCGFTCKQLRCLNQHVSIKHEGVKPYQCIFCEFSTARRYRLEAHESLHTGVGRITCEVCGQTFGTNSKLRIHRLRVHEKKPTHFCTLCDYSGYNQNDITRHTNSCHNGDLKHLCQQCGAGFSSEMALKHHSLRKHEEKVCYSCPHCVFSCFSEATLKCHVQRQHPHLECGICKEAFESREELEEHRRIHFHQRCEYCSFAAKERQQLVQHLLDIHEGSLEAEGKQFKCSFCGFSCCHQLVFDYHMKAHGGTRMYKCTDCDYTTKNKQKITYTCSYACADPSRLKYHMRIHQDERKYLCPDCGYKCKWVNQLKYHMTKHTGLKPYRCDECEYCTNRADALRIHKETRHSDTRSFICEQCGKAFKTRFLLKTHLKKHSEEKPYVCNVCFRGFRWAAGLRHHYLTHTNEHPFFCRHCSYKAKQKFQVIKHILRHHPQLVTEDPNDGVGKDPAAPVVHLLHAKLDSLAGVPATLLVPKAATETEVVPQDLQQS
uniref:Zinc finger protein 142 n=1 Tax=Latimeria chalumnae TaxID=7897 RepID=H3BDA5_LATCH